MGTKDAQFWGVYKHILQCARMALIFLHLNPSVKTICWLKSCSRGDSRKMHIRKSVFVFLLKCGKSGEDAGHCCLYKEFEYFVGV